MAQRETGLRVMVFYGPREHVEAEEFLAVLRKDHGVEGILAPTTTLGQAAALLRGHAAAFVGGDTGPGHLAAALCVPTVQIFGPSCAVRNSPKFEGSRIRTVQKRSHPCTNTFRRRCPLHGNPALDDCMAVNTPEQVGGLLKDVLEPASIEMAG